MSDQEYDNKIADILHRSIRGVEKEYVICAANWYQDGKVHIHQPRNIEKGFVISGRRHHNCFITFAIIRNVQPEDQPERVNIEQGFLTSKDRWVTREEAANIALEIKQIVKPTKILFSEDLY